MPVYIALIRGINVGGKTMPMAALRDMLSAIGHGDAKTYIQSGNAVFTATGRSGREIARAIEAAIAKKFGYEAAVIVRSLEDWRSLLKANPYAKRKLGEGERLFISFLEEAPAKAAAARLEAIQDAKDEVKVRGREAFLLVRGSYGESKLSNAFVEKTLGLRATTRNMPTALKLLEMAEALQAG
jgi:uncharacterized protein (DUF1697 family)